MKLATLVALWLATTVFGLACAKLTKVLSSLGYYILEQFDLDSPQLFPWLLMSVNQSRSRGQVRVPDRAKDAAATMGRGEG